MLARLRQLLFPAEDAPGGLAPESSRVLRGVDEDAVASVIVDRICALVDVPVGALVLVSDDGREGHGVLCRVGGVDQPSFPTTVMDLQNEPSGVASAAFESRSVAIYDVRASSQVSRERAEAFGALSAAFVPVLAAGRVVAVFVAAESRRHRTFGANELGALEGLAAEVAPDLAQAHRTGGALALERALARLTRRIRDEAELDAAMRLAVAGAADLLGATRCYLRVGPGMAAEWDAEGFAPIGDDAAGLPVPTLAVVERRPVAVDDVSIAPDLDEAGRALLLGLGTRAVLAVPVELADGELGALGFHRSVAGVWRPSDVLLAETVARELGSALRGARLLAESERRLRHQNALLRSAQTLTSELGSEGVLQRLVDEVVELLGADAADCRIGDGGRPLLRCRAVRGLPDAEVGREVPVERIASEAILAGRAVLKHDFGSADFATDSYRRFAEAMEAPIALRGEMRGILGVYAVAPGRFHESDLDLLDAFASLASLALGNAEAFEERTRQAGVQRGFFRIASVLGRSLSLPATFEAVAQAAAEALGGSSAAVLMNGAAGADLAGAFEVRPEVAALLEAGVASVLDSTFSDGRVLVSSMLADDERFEPELRAVLSRLGTRSLIAIPVETPRHEAGGVVLVFFPDVHVFTDDDLELARHLADATRGALERSLLYEAERSSRALAQQLARTGGLLATELDPDAVLDEVVQQAPALLGADACAVRMLEDDELVLRAFTGKSVDAPLGHRASALTLLAGDVAQSRSPLSVEWVADARQISADPMLGEGAAYLGVPLVGPEGALHGVLAVYAGRPRSWREEEIEALLALASSTSAALSNAELYQRVALEKERSFAILANIADGIVAVDRDSCVVLWNAAAERITGVAAADALGRTPNDVLGRRLEASDDESGSRLVAFRRGAEEISLSLSEAIMRDPAGAVSGRIFAFRDISADRLVEQMKSDFVSTVSHELRTPLTSIYGFAETLLREDIVFGDFERKTFLGYIASESERLTGIVDALLSVARLDTGDLQVNLAATDLASLVAEAVSAAEAAVAENGHSFVLDVPDAPLPAEADREKVRQILENLIDNAVKFSPTGGRVTVRARATDDGVEVRVDDEGVGIPRGEQDRIFRKFTRADDAVAGTGLGLFIASGLVSAMGGRIWVESAEGEGSSFGFELPAAGVRSAPAGITTP